MLRTYRITFFSPTNSHRLEILYYLLNIYGLNSAAKFGLQKFVLLSWKFNLSFLCPVSADSLAAWHIFTL